VTTPSAVQKECDKRYSFNADMNTFVSGFKLLTAVGKLPNNQIPVEYMLL
jgi:hypothetical protein